MWILVCLIFSIVLNVFLFLLFIMEKHNAKENLWLYHKEIGLTQTLLKTVNKKTAELEKKDKMIKELEEKSESIAKHFREYVDMIHGEF